MLPLLLLVVALVALTYLYTSRNFNYWRARGIPFEKPTPFLGNTSLVLFRKCFGDYMKDLYEKSSGPIYGFFIFDKPCMLIREPEIIKQILVKDFQNFSDRTVAMNLKDDPVGSQMLFLIHNPAWKSVRQKMTTAFSSGKLKLMFPLMVEATKDFINYVNRQNGLPIETKNMVLKFSTDVITSCAFGVKGSCFESENSDFFAAAKRVFGFTWSRGLQMTSYFISPYLVKLFKMKFLHPESVAFLKGIFLEVMKLKKKTNIKRNDLIDSLLELKEDDSELTFALDSDLAVAQAVQFFVAGYETSGSTSCFALYELALHVDVQDRLRKEIRDVCKRNNGLTYEAIKEMKYLDMVLCETLRLFPILPFLDRVSRIDYKIQGTDFTIEKGMGVYIPMRALHLDPKYFPNPEKFDPERFTIEKKAKLPYCSYMPFGEGPRNCIGARFGSMSSKLAIISMVSRYEIIKTNETPLTIDFDPKGFLLSPVKPIPLVFKKITDNLTLDDDCFL